MLSANIIVDQSNYALYVNASLYGVFISLTRPLNDEEQKTQAQSVISCNQQKKEVIISQSSLMQADKTFTFDKVLMTSYSNSYILLSLLHCISYYLLYLFHQVFGPKAQQRLIYDHAISPIVLEALEGYNCTVFAFGQTGTGKTYTMEGEMKSKVRLTLACQINAEPYLMISVKNAKYIK